MRRKEVNRLRVIRIRMPSGGYGYVSRLKRPGRALSRYLAKMRRRDSTGGQP